MEIVNLNLDAEQYVSATHVRSVDVLTRLTAMVAIGTVTPDDMRECLRTSPDSYRGLTNLDRRIAALVNTAQSPPLDIELKRGKATNFQLELVVGKWITNVVGKEFSLDLGHLRGATAITSSPILKTLVSRLSE
ncbi:hypothetical protein F4780DRAFT_777277 [Xylariomycetidae sp. FL0641]|nr:hypothetical protein F4780DRAFT_777277 [Xylariomycetidae sp. FL0641]